MSALVLTVPAVLILGLTFQAEERRPAASPNTVARQVATTTAPLPASESTRSFEEGDVVELARTLAAAPPRPRDQLTPGLEKLTYVQYREMHFRVDKSLWSNDRTPFRIDLLPAGFVYTAPVTISVVEKGVVSNLAATPDMYQFGSSVPKDLQDKSLSLSGFRIRTQLNTRNYWDEFLVFQGASYFRAVGQGQNYGISARGLALRTGEPEGEEFPAFTQFWIEKPVPGAKEIVVHALLESPSVTGAYRFAVRPGRDTEMDVKFTLFPRVDLRNVGIAPLTSMFLFDGTNRRRFDDFRYRVHDSDGLLFISQQGEYVWRHLANPRNLQLSAFTAEQPRAFGLMQRARLLSDYQDLEANYERRPSAWVEFAEDAAPGPLRLIEIPTSNETNDNIVAFWQPRDVLLAGQPYSGAYRLNWTAESLVTQPLGRFATARSGTNTDGSRKLMALDLVGAGTSPDGMELEVTGSAGQVFHPVIQTNPAIRGLRATFEFDPAGADLVEFRAQVRKKGQAVSETWLYRWTAS
jgi:glucans biosynthesis protein